MINLFNVFLLLALVSCAATNSAVSSAGSDQVGAKSKTIQLSAAEATSAMDLFDSKKFVSHKPDNANFSRYVGSLRCKIDEASPADTNCVLIDKYIDPDQLGGVEPIDFEGDEAISFTHTLAGMGILGSRPDHANFRVWDYVFDCFRHLGPDDKCSFTAK